MWWGLPGAVAGQAVGSLITLALSMWWAHKHLGFRWPWADTARIGLASVVMAGVLTGVHPDASLWGLLGGTLLGALVYVVLMALLFAPLLRRWWAVRQGA